MNLGDEATETEVVRRDRLDLDLLSVASLVDLVLSDLDGIPGAVRAVSRELSDAISAAEKRVAGGGRIIYVGAGTAGRLGVLDASECPPTFGVDEGRVVGVIAGGPMAVTHAVEGAEDDPAAGASDLQHLDIVDRDVVVGVSASGRTQYVVGALRYAKTRGALVLCVVNTTGSQIAALADYAIEAPAGPEIVAGSTRLMAGTVQKILLNTISTTVMVRTGHTYGNFMVGVQPSNSKLRDRSVRIVSAIAQADRDTAEEALLEADGEVKVAIVILRLRTTAPQARSLLAESGGRLRDVIDVSASESKQELEH